ncbi:MAG: SPOR domain-containing protein, partial [Gammaproteobacteria bacterium]
AYTVQLLATSEKKGLIGHIDKNGIKGEMIVFETQRNGKKWYALLYGVYPSREQAIKARDSLPKSYKASNAWVRSVISIKSSK